MHAKHPEFGHATVLDRKQVSFPVRIENERWRCIYSVNVCGPRTTLTQVIRMQLRVHVSSADWKQNCAAYKLHGTRTLKLKLIVLEHFVWKWVVIGWNFSQENKGCTIDISLIRVFSSALVIWFTLDNNWNWKEKEWSK